MAIDLNSLQYKLDPNSYAADADKNYYENAGDFVGYDPTGNAVFNKDGQYSAFDKANFGGLHNALAADTKTQNMKFSDYQSANQANQLGDYQGIDKETGSAVFKNAAGELSGANKQDFGDLYNYMQKQNPNQQWLNPEYEKQFNAAKDAGTTFAGVDASGNQIAKDALGHYQKIGDQDSGFSKFAKYNMADQKFTGPEGVTNVVKGENVTQAAPVAGQQRAVAQNAQSNIATRMPFQNRGLDKFAASQNKPADNTPAPAASPQASPQPTAAPAASAPASTPQAVPSEAAPASTAGTVLGGMTTAAKAAPSPAAPTAMSNVFNKPSMFDTAKAMATGAAKTAVTGAVQNQLTNATNAAAETAGISAQAITNPAAYARQMALQQASSAAKDQAAAMGINTSALGDTSKILSNPLDYAKTQAENAIAKQYGFDPNILNNPLQAAQNMATQQATNTLGFNPLEAAKNPVGYAKAQAINVAKTQAADALSSQLGFPITAEAFSDPIGYAKKQGLDYAKTQALKAASDQLVEHFGESSVEDLAGNAVPYGAMLKGGIDVVGSLLHGGLNANSSNKASQAAAQAALTASLTPFLGPAAALVNPETLNAMSGLSNAGYGATTKLLGNTAGAILGSPLQVGGAGLKLGGDLLGGALGGVGDIGSSVYNAGKAGIGGLKQIAKGNVLQGLGTVGHGIGNLVSNAVIKAPSKAIGGAIHSVGQAIGSIFCFDGDTEILMENGSYRKIKTLKIGDKIALGGMITSIGQGLTSDLYNYNGVKVSGGHAVYENKKWTRVESSKNGENLHIKENAIVFPMSSEHHLIVTKGQIWADNLEVDDTYNKKDSDIMKELNSKKRRNKMLDVYLKSTFGEEHGSSDDKKIQKK
ncbi:MAG: Hint domain-containing protein [Bacteroidales bacterium]